jgi:hypothetical protein
MLRGNLTSERGLGRRVVADIVSDVPGIDLNMIKQQLANLNASGDYARIIGEFSAAIRQLLIRWNRPLVSLRSVVYDTQYSLKEAFGIPRKAAWTTFATWDHFGIACINSQTPMAREMKEFFHQSKDKHEFLDALSTDIGMPI